ncbi:sensor histidine kinase [Streptococcus cameli]
MIGKFIKQHLGWILLYLVLVLIFLATFFLYRLPLSIFANSLLFASTVFVLVLCFQYVRFRRFIQDLDHLSIQQEKDLQTPLEQAFYAVLMKELNQAQAEKETLQQQSIKLNSLIKMWSHQIKVPLASLDLMVQTNQLKTQEVASQVHAIQHYLTILLNYMKFQEKLDDYRFENVSIRPLITTIIKDYRMHCLAKDLSVQIEGDWQLLTDKKWLSFAISQLIDNAIKYSRSGGRIRILMKESQLLIQDEGMGILPEDLPRLFDEGFTGFNGHQHHKSTGLGLYMTKLILDELNLNISIESVIDEGTSVIITSKKNSN